MHTGFRHLRYMVQWIEPPAARHSRADQRTVADQMIRKIGPDWRLWSRSHSRGTIAVAAGNAPLSRLGVDVEYTDPRRPWRDIATAYVPNLGQELDPSTACRAWTFGEAYFKAFGANPAADILTNVIRAPTPDDEPVAFGARRYWYSECLPDDFWLTLVWEEEI
jgi:phosphopantetheinyl transferase